MKSPAFSSRYFHLKKKNAHIYRYIFKKRTRRKELGDITSEDAEDLLVFPTFVEEIPGEFLQLGFIAFLLRHTDLTVFPGV